MAREFKDLYWWYVLVFFVIDVTLLTEPYRGSERVIGGGGLVVTGACARVKEIWQQSSCL